MKKFLQTEHSLDEIIDTATKKKDAQSRSKIMGNDSKEVNRIKMRFKNHKNDKQGSNRATPAKNAAINNTQRKKNVGLQRNLATTARRGTSKQKDHLRRYQL